jgi:hypothetical protein
LLLPSDYGVGPSFAIAKLLIFEQNRDEHFEQSLTAAVVCSMQNNAPGQIDDTISQPA